eukprot:7357984-Prymnesium_polylepis.1
MRRSPRLARPADVSSSAELVYVCQLARTVHQAVSAGNFRESAANLRELARMCEPVANPRRLSRIRES